MFKNVVRRERIKIYKYFMPCLWIVLFLFFSFIPFSSYPFFQIHPRKDKVKLSNLYSKYGKNNTPVRQERKQKKNSIAWSEPRKSTELNEMETLSAIILLEIDFCCYRSFRSAYNMAPFIRMQGRTERKHRFHSIFCNCDVLTNIKGMEEGRQLL